MTRAIPQRVALGTARPMSGTGLDNFRRWPPVVPCGDPAGHRTRFLEVLAVTRRVCAAVDGHALNATRADRVLQITRREWIRRGGCWCVCVNQSNEQGE